jgi:hypothetical protein
MKSLDFIIINDYFFGNNILKSNNTRKSSKNWFDILPVKSTRKSE